MLTEIFDQIKDQWVRAKHQKKHPFRYFVLSTAGANSFPLARTVVLRNFDPQILTFTIYTDLRSQKMADLHASKDVCLLFYDSKRLWQIQVVARLLQESSDPILYQQLPLPAQKDYTTTLAPGSEISNPEEIAYLDDKNFFVSLKFEAVSIESLKLKRPHHVRTRFDKESNWKGIFLVP